MSDNELIRYLEGHGFISDDAKDAVIALVKEKQEIRAKVIDDFTEQLCVACGENTYPATINGLKNVDILTLDGVTETIFEVAERMKGGAT